MQHQVTVQQQQSQERNSQKSLEVHTAVKAIAHICSISYLATEIQQYATARITHLIYIWCHTHSQARQAGRIDIRSRNWTRNPPWCCEFNDSITAKRSIELAAPARSLIQGFITRASLKNDCLHNVQPHSFRVQVHGRRRFPLPALMSGERGGRPLLSGIALPPSLKVPLASLCRLPLLCLAVGLLSCASASAATASLLQGTPYMHGPLSNVGGVPTVRLQAACPKKYSCLL